MKHIAMIFLGKTEAVYFFKYICSYPYYLGKNCGWKSTYAYFSPHELSNKEFEQYCSLDYLGNEERYENMKNIAADYITTCARDIDVLMLAHYTGATYKLARLAKKVNPKIKVYVKLDMGEENFRHFYDGTLLRKIRNIPEYWKSSAIDLFTVENRAFYNVLKDIRLFRHRIEYLPNPVSLLGIELSEIKAPQERENIILTVGRPGVPVKNTELFVEAVQRVDRDLFADWKFYIVGNPEPQFRKYADEISHNDPWIKEHMIQYGGVTDRKE